MRGPGSLNHNRRSFTAENVDPKRSSLNVVYRDEPIQKVYHELFDEAVKRYNAKQKRKDRCTIRSSIWFSVGRTSITGSSKPVGRITWSTTIPSLFSSS